MTALSRPPALWFSRQWAALSDGWNRFWFTPADPTTLGAIRIGTGLMLLYIHLGAIADLSHFVGPEAWIDPAAVGQLKTIGQDAPDALDRVARGWWGQSLWFYVQQPALLWLTYGLFLTAVLCFTVGLFSRAAAVVVWAGHLSYIHRGFITWDGMDSILAMLTLYLMCGPTGATLSLDRLRSRSRQTERSWAANVVIRMIQVHMCVIYLCAGLSKLQGARWWDGTAVWMTMVLPEYVVVDLSWLAYGGDWLCHLVSNVGVVVTLGFEISFAYLIWNRTMRPLLLFLAVLLHAGIGLVMGLGAFGAVMLIGCLAFVAPESIRAVVELFSQGLGRLRRNGVPTQVRRAA